MGLTWNLANLASHNHFQLHLQQNLGWYQGQCLENTILQK